ncbi:MAG: ABC transporter ATP-binding protein [Cryobacterium sp.]|nr:ABC transporter ATP-binding protein [Cryobacterium sp.]
MRDLPEPYKPPGKLLSPFGLLGWIIGRQWSSVFQGTIYDIIWLLGLALTPWAIGRAIDEGLIAKNFGAFAAWLGVVVWLQLQHTLIQGLRDRAGSINYSRAEARLEQFLARTSARVTVAAEKELHPGAVVTMASESWAISFLPINVGSLASALIAFATVAVLLLRDSILLGSLVLVSVPVFSLFSFVLVKSMRNREDAMWEARSALNIVATDTVKGLRVLHGIGGAERFLERFRGASVELRLAGKKVATPLAAADALAVLIAGSLVAGLTWLGAALVAQGELQVGALVAFYGYAGFLVLPVSLINQVMTVTVQAWVSAKKAVALQAVEPYWSEGTGHPKAPESGPRALLEDELTGVRLHRGEFLAVAIPNEVEAQAVVARLARLRKDETISGVLLNGTPITELPISGVRTNVVAIDPVPFLFSGSLREVLDPWSKHSDPEILRAVSAVDVGDIVDSAPGGLDAPVGERGLEFSGGQRSRLGAARALLSGAEVLILHEPTASVDASTEERMAVGIRRFRQGLSTLVVTSSPLVLALADRVALIVGGRLVAEGRHDELIDSSVDYRFAVLRQV